MYFVFFNAQQQSFYGGSNIGNANINSSKNVAIDMIIASGGYNFYGSENNFDSGFKIFGSLKFNQYLALEGGYANLGGYNSSGVCAVARETIYAEIKSKATNYLSI